MSREFGLTVLAIALLGQLLSAPGVAQGDGSLVSEGLSHRNTGTTLYATSSLFKCTTDLQITVTSAAEISSLIKQYTAKGEPVKIRVTRPGMHSASGFVCAGKRGSTKLEFDASKAPGADSPTTTISLLLHRMNRMVDVDSERHRLTVEAGMTLQSLLDAAEAHNMSVPTGAVSLYSNLTVGGVISASAHGSGSSISELVRELKWVNARGEVIVSGVETEEGTALLGGLGLLGVVTEVTLQLEPWSRTVVEVRDDLDDENIVAELQKIMKQETPYVTCTWRPDLQSYRVVLHTPVRDGEVVEPALDVNATNVLLAALGGDVARAVSEMHVAWGNDLTDDSDSADFLNAAACGAAEAGSRVPMFLDSNGQPTKHATLPTNRAELTPECSPNCFFDPHHMGIAVPAGEFAIKLSHLSSWVRDVKLIVKSELAEVEARLPGRGKTCLTGPFMLRFGSGTASPISTSVGTDDVAYVQWLPLLSARTPRKPGKHSPVWETIEQLSLCKYHGRPSYGQNHERSFRHPRCHVRDNFPGEGFEKMIALQEAHDPERVFQPKLFEHVLSKSGPDYFELCALENWCYCEENAHCAEKQECVASPVFPEYKICKVVVETGKRHEEL